MTEAHEDARVVFVAWTMVEGRSREVAAALGGQSRAFYPRALRRRKLVLLRFAVSAIQQVGYLTRVRPGAIIVTVPPLVPAVLAWAYAALTGSVLVLDSHPTSFGRKDHRLSQRLLFVHRWLARRAELVLVSVDELAATVERWGGRALVMHEAPPQWDVAPAPPLSGRPTVLFVGNFGADEPVMAVLAAAALRPDIAFEVTGALDRLPRGARLASPPNVRFLGFLAEDRFAESMSAADLVLVLTTERTSVVRAGQEAVHAGRPLVVSDTVASKAAFAHAVHVGNHARAIADGIGWAIEHHAELVEAVGDARREQRERWQGQLAQLVAALDRGVGNGTSAGQPER